MKDPCNNCLVQPCCTKICWDKDNYKILLGEKVRNFQEAGIRGKYFNEFYKTIRKESANNTSLLRIKSNKRKLKGKP